MFKYNISFLNSYLKLKKITQKDFASRLDIDEKIVYRSLRGERLLSQEELNGILIQFNVENYDELVDFIKFEYIEFIKSKIQNTFKESESKIGLILRDYIHFKNIPLSRLSELLGIRFNTIKALLNNDVEIHMGTSNKLYGYFNVENNKELKDKLLVEMKDEVSNIINIDDFMVLLYRYILVKNISTKDMANELSISQSNFFKSSSEKTSTKVLNKVLSYFHVSNLEELKAKIYNELNEIIEQYEKSKIEYDLSAVESFLNLKSVSLEELGELLNVNKAQLYKYIIVTKKISEEDFRLLTDSLHKLPLGNVENFLNLMNEFQEFSRKKQSNENKYNIFFLSDYLKLKNISVSNLSKSTGLSNQLLSKYLSGKNLVSEENFKLILDAFNVKNYDELYKLTANKTDLIKDDVDKSFVSYDISFLYDYIRLKNISLKELSKKTNILIRTLQNALEGKTRISYDNYIKIQTFFKVTSYNELVDLVKNDKTTYLNNINEEVVTKYDITFLKDFLALRRISQSSVANSVGIKQCRLCNGLNGKHKVSRNTLNKLLEYFGVSTYDELLKLVEWETSVADQNFNENVILDKKMIDIKFLFKLLRNYQISENDYKVIAMLFNEEKDYNVLQISKITNYSTTHILKIYSFCLKLYNEEIGKRNLGKLEYKLEQEE